MDVDGAGGEEKVGALARTRSVVCLVAACTVATNALCSCRNHMRPQARVRKKRARRKPRLPKGYDPSLPGGGLPPPDPERWLPKWERSDFKKKKKKSSARDKDTKSSQVRVLVSGGGGTAGTLPIMTNNRTGP